MTRHLLFILFWCIAIGGYAQMQDSSIVDSSAVTSSSISVAPVAAFDNVLYFPHLSQWKAAPEMMFIAEKPSASKEGTFYFLIGLIFYFAFVKTVFPRYVHNMFTLFFQANFRRKQTREQLQQDAFPSLLLNIFYIIIVSFFITEIAFLQEWTQLSFWTYCLSCALILTGMYLVKYLVVRIGGVVSGLSAFAEMYLFTVFLINKLLAVLLLPLLFLLAFCEKSQISPILLVTAVIIGLSFFFRYLLSYNAVHKNLRVSPLQFFIYLCIVEFLPFLVFYEILFNKFGYNF